MGYDKASFCHLTQILHLSVQIMSVCLHFLHTPVRIQKIGGVTSSTFSRRLEGHFVAQSVPAQYHCPLDAKIVLVLMQLAHFAQAWKHLIFYGVLIKGAQEKEQHRRGFVLLESPRTMTAFQQQHICSIDQLLMVQIQASLTVLCAQLLMCRCCHSPLCRSLQDLTE